MKRQEEHVEDVLAGTMDCAVQKQYVTVCMYVTDCDVLRQWPVDVTLI